MLEMLFLLSRSGIFFQTNHAVFNFWLLPWCTPKFSVGCISEPAFHCFHGNWPKVPNSEIVKKFAGPFDLDFQGFWQQNPRASWPNWASKSAFPYFHGNRSGFQNSNAISSLSDPDRLSVPIFVKIGRETAKELINGKSVRDCLHVSFLKL